MGSWEEVVTVLATQGPAAAARAPEGVEAEVAGGWVVAWVGVAAAWMVEVVGMEARGTRGAKAAREAVPREAVARAPECEGREEAAAKDPEC